MKKSLALFLMVMLCFSSLPASVISTAQTADEENISTFDLDSVPKNIKKVLKTDNVKGITNIGKTDLYSIDVVNTDGQHTVCTYQFPVKYVDDGGSIQYIDNSIVSHSKKRKIKGKSFAYTNKGNRIKTYFPENIAEGVLLSDDKYQVSFSPAGNINNAYAENKEVSFNNEVENVVEYSNVFGEGTKLQYVPTYTGLKENIVLEKYSGNNIFEFTINTDGLVPAFESGNSIPLKDPSTGEIVSVLGQVDARDSYKGTNENNDKHFTINNKLSISPAEDENTYVLTVTVDKDFLESATTVYPVVIDPILSVYSSNHMDTTIYAAQPNTQNFYADAYNYVGNRGGEYGINAVTLVKFNFNSSSLPTTINPDAVTKAEYFVYEASGTTYPTRIDAYPLESAWSDTTVTYNSYLSNSMRNINWLLDYKIVKSSGWYKYNLTYM
ncbi:DNRLRE domain-containing protein [Acetivibrio cellulolyticus]|uniref:DNRLRE domain-containing protein n=1 Tax=Acetivibrio cellulolyticus TaxID=35830 RepID=UPI0001E2DF11|nr:DNRLRE domain-containing protein [Acetivibrio cellulolyticus]